MAEDDFGAHDDYQRELDEEAEFEQQRADAERRNAAENVAGITVLQEGTHHLGLAIEVQMCGVCVLCCARVCMCACMWMFVHLSGLSVHALHTVCVCNHVWYQRHVVTRLMSHTWLFVQHNSPA